MKKQIEFYNPKKSRFYFSNLLLVCLLFFSNPLSIKGQPLDPFTKITDDYFVDFSPVIEGDYIVYGRRNIASDNGIYLYNIQTGDTMSIMRCNHGNFDYIDISGDRIVWQQYENGSWDIYNYLISRPDLGAYPLIDFPGDEQSPAIDGDVLVYIEDNGVPFSRNLFMYNIATATLSQITTDDDYQQYSPDVYGNYIVWASTTGNGDIYMYNIYKDEITQITDNEYEQRNPTIYKKKIVWEDKRNGNWDIYLHPIDYFPGIEPTRANLPVYTGEIGQLNNWDQVHPVMTDDYIVFQDNRNYNWDIYLHTFINPIVGTSKPLVQETRGQMNPSIWGNTIVWEDEREYTGTGFYFTNLWMWQKPPGVDIAVNIEDTPDPVPLESELTYYVYVSNFGTQSAYNLQFNFTLPASVDFVSMSGFGPGGYSRVGNELSCLLDSVPAGKTDTVTIIVQPLIETILACSSNVVSVEEDVNPENNTGTASTRVIWKIPRKIDKGGNPSLVADASGNPHFAYLSEGFSGQLMYATIKNGKVLTSIIDSSTYNTSPAIAVDSNNKIHIAFGQGDESYSGNNVLKYITNKSGTWSQPQTVAENLGSTQSVCIRIDQKDSVHISCMTSLWSNGSLEYFVQDGGWIRRHSRAGTYNSSSFDLDSANYAHFVFYDLASYGLCYQTNSPAGTWGAIEAPDDAWNGGQMESLSTEIALDYLSKPHVSYVGSAQEWGNEDYKYALKSGQNWSDRVIDEGTFAGGENAIDTDPSGNPHILFYNTLNNRLKYAWKEEGAWHKTVVDYFNWYGSGARNQDIFVDISGHIHIVYNKEGEICYVTNTVPVPEPEIQVLPQMLDFIERIVGDTSEAKTVIIRNVGEGDLYIDDISIVWRDSINFSISRSSCSLVHPGDSCSVDVKFNPEILGNKQAMLWISSNDPVKPFEGVSLKGVGLQGLFMEYGIGTFGDVPIGDSAINDFRLKNLGNTALVVQGIFLEGEGAEHFYYTGLPDVPFTIQEGDSVEFKVVFKPLSEGNYSASLKYFSTGGDLSTTLSGTGIIPTFQVQGEIRLPDNSLVNQGWIWLVNLDENSPYPTYHYKPLEGAESFTFLSLHEMDITLWFDPDEDAFPGYLRTYLGNTSFREEAEIINLDHDIGDLSIVLIAAPDPGNGGGNASGSLIEEGGKKSSMQLKSGKYEGAGTALEDVPVYLTGLAGDILYADRTDSNGEFEFEALSVGNYLFKVDYKGYPMAALNDTLKVTEANQEFEITAIVSNGEISWDISKITGLQPMGGDLNFKVYPNPFVDRFFIEIRSDGEDIEFSISDMAGKCVYKGQHSGMKEGTGIIQIDAGHFEAGFYLLSVRKGSGKYYMKILKR